MKLLSRFKKPVEKRSSSKAADETFWTRLFGGARTKSGQTISPEKALQASAVYACIRVLSETIASLPLKIYTHKKGGGKEEVKDFYLYKILHDIPNFYMTSFEFREVMMMHLNLRGNFFGLKEINGKGEIANIIPLNPARMTVMVDGRVISYEYTWDDGKTQTFKYDEIWHVKGLSMDGFIGLSPVSIARESIGLALATEEHGARLFSNDARPGGLLVHPGKLSDPAKKRLKDSWQAAQAGGDNAYKVAVLEEGLKWEPVGFSNEDSQFLETRNFQVEDIARIFRVPTVLIGHPDKNSTFASAEQFFLSFTKYTISPWLKRIEQSISKHLFLTDKERETYFAEFSIDGLLRGDIKSRYEAFAIARQNTWMNANEIREKENMNPIDGGDVYENPNIQVKEEQPNANTTKE